MLSIRHVKAKKNMPATSVVSTFFAKYTKNQGDLMSQKALLAPTMLTSKLTEIETLEEMINVYFTILDSQERKSIRTAINARLTDVLSFYDLNESVYFYIKLIQLAKKIAFSNSPVGSNKTPNNYIHHANASGHLFDVLIKHGWILLDQLGAKDLSTHQKLMQNIIDMTIFYSNGYSDAADLVNQFLSSMDILIKSAALIDDIERCLDQSEAGLSYALEQLSLRSIDFPSAIVLVEKNMFTTFFYRSTFKMKQGDVELASMFMEVCKNIKSKPVFSENIWMIRQYSHLEAAFSLLNTQLDDERNTETALESESSVLVKKERSKRKKKAKKKSAIIENIIEPVLESIPPMAKDFIGITARLPKVYVENAQARALLDELSCICELHECDGFLFGGSIYKNNPNDFDIVFPNIFDADNNNGARRFLDRLINKGATIRSTKVISGHPDFQVIKLHWFAHKIDVIVTPKSLLEHLAILDFTAGSIYYSLRRKQMYRLPLSTALQDIDRKKLNLMTDPLTSFSQDPSRIFRAIRIIASGNGYTLSFKCEDAIRVLFMGSHNLFKMLPDETLFLQLGLLFSSVDRIKHLNELSRLGLMNKLIDALVCRPDTRAYSYINQLSAYNNTHYFFAYCPALFQPTIESNNVLISNPQKMLGANA